MIFPFALLGAAAGTVHFVAISRDANLLARGGSPLAAFGLRLGRALLTLVVLVAAARQGWPVLLGAAGGFMVARQIVLRWLGTVSP
ncbi:ATP synthase subunit I [Sphingomonas sp. MMS24-J13]|uniref:N-ATPase subunit AtpR n=1 Tax=Sphingomonas sp. MMS24-J13 TaxID=3238686 RepID=UPI00384EDA13